MESRHSNSLRMEKLGNTTSTDIAIDHLNEASKSLLMNEKLKLVGTLAAEVAHEIRNPLTSIKGFIQLLNMGVSKPEYYSIINSEINEIEETINRLMGLAETQSVNFRSSDIGLILERTISSMDDLARFKGIEIISNFQVGFLFIYCNEVLLQQVFENSIGHAIETSAYNKKVYITCKTHDLHVHIKIKDQGVVRPNTRTVYLFNPFYCIEEDDTGLSPISINEIIKEHNGTIQVTSGVDIGTTVDIYLPLRNS